MLVCDKCGRTVEISTDCPYRGHKGCVAVRPVPTELALSELAFCAERVRQKYGYQPDNITEKDWQEWIDVKAAVIKAKAALASRPVPEEGKVLVPNKPGWWWRSNNGKGYSPCLVWKQFNNPQLRYNENVPQNVKDDGLWFGEAVLPQESDSRKEGI